MSLTKQTNSADESPFKDAVAIIGLGGRFPDAENVAQFWDNICKARVSIREVPKERWDAALFYSPDKSAPEKTYSAIGGFISQVNFDAKLFRIPPRTLQSIDDIQKLSLMAVVEALQDAGLEVFPETGQGKAFDRERTAIIVGNAMGGEICDRTSLRIWCAETKQIIDEVLATSTLPSEQRARVLTDFEAHYKSKLPPLTEDSMPGELSNCITGRIANVFDLRGPNFTTDAACAASMASLKTAFLGLLAHEFDLAIVGGADRSMAPDTYVKFSKIGALSPNISAPFDARANGFVMGEGVGILLLKRLQDAELAGDKIYAVIRGIGAASDGKGKGITAPNPRGQRSAIKQTYLQSGVPLRTVDLFEAHGTSTVVGDSTELRVLTDLLKEDLGTAAVQAARIGSVKSLIGHLKSAAGAASLIKTACALYHKVLPPSANFISPPVDSPLTEGYLQVQTVAEPWPAPKDGLPRRAGVSAFGFGGTNFHVLCEEYIPGAYQYAGAPLKQGTTVSVPAALTAAASSTTSAAPLSPTVALPAAAARQLPGREELWQELVQLFAEQTGYAPTDFAPEYQLEADLGIDTIKQAEIFSLIREKYQLGKDENFRLADIPNLESVVTYVLQRLSVTGAGGTASAQALKEPEAKSTATSGGATPKISAEEHAANKFQLFFFGAENAAQALAKARAQLPLVVNYPADLLKWRQTEPTSVTALGRLSFVAKDLQEVTHKVQEASVRKPKMLASQGIFVNEGPSLRAQGGRIAFLFPGQGSQYLGMLADLASAYPLVADTFREADEVLEPLIGAKLSEIVWAKPRDEAERAAYELRLRETQNCQPAMLTANVAMLRLFYAHGVRPEVTAGHSLGEYAACVAAGVLSFRDALYAVCARGREMAGVQVEDSGKMAVVAGDLHKVQEVLKQVNGYVITANKNCYNQTVIAGNSTAVLGAIQKFIELGMDARLIPVSHAFHCKIVALAAKPLEKVLRGLQIMPARVPILSNFDANYYPSQVDEIINLLSKQLASPVEFIAQVERMYADGVRIFVEVGPKRAITGFVRNILEKFPHSSIATNHYKKSGVEGFLEALAALSSEGVAIDYSGKSPVGLDVLWNKESAAAPRELPAPTLKAELPALRSPVSSLEPKSIVVSGVSALLPTEEVVEDLSVDPASRLLAGENFIRPISDPSRQAILEQRVIRLNKSAGQFEFLNDLADVIQLTARFGHLDLKEHFGIDENISDALDITAKLALAAGIEALRDAGLPLCQRYRVTSTGKKLPDRFVLPPSLAASTGVIFAAAFPGIERLIEEISLHAAARAKLASAGAIENFVSELLDSVQDPLEKARLKKLATKQLTNLRQEADLYTFNRKFLFRVLSMGHAQLAELILAQGPNTQINAACASSTQAVGIATDWIRLGRCARVLVVTADDVTNDISLPWFAAGFLASGAATVEGDLSRAATPFGASRNGLILGAGATGMVIEAEEVLKERGLEPIAEVVHTAFCNSAFHGSRLDTAFISEHFTKFVDETCTKLNCPKTELARRAFFMSHETYTPARGGSAEAEIVAIRQAFGTAAPELTIANTKGYTGHPMAAGLEDVLALKALQKQYLPKIANLTPESLDPTFKDLTFALGGPITADVAFRFGAGFGSQVSLAAYRRRAETIERLVAPALYETWVAKQAGRREVGLEIVARTLRIAESGGVPVFALGVPSLKVAPTRAQAVASEVQSSAPLKPANLPADFSLASLLQDIQQFVATYTGYNLEDLDPDHTLEADLGIDTVKQAEMLGLLRERYGFKREENLQIAKLQTLRLLATYIYERLTSEPGSIAVKTPAETLSVSSPQPQVVEHAGQVSVPESSLAGLTADKQQLLQELLQLFAEHTGYEVSDLDPNYQLEADLGIDTVKQAEVLALIRQKYQLEKDESLQLADLTTLHLVAEYVYKRLTGGHTRAEVKAQAADLSGTPETESALPKIVKTPAGILPREQELLVELTALFAEHTGYEVSDLDPNYQLEADLGIDTVKQAEMLALIRSRYGLAPDENFKLTDVPNLRSIAAYVLAKSEGAATNNEVVAAAISTAPVVVESLEPRYTVKKVVPVLLNPDNAEVLACKIEQRQTLKDQQLLLAGSDQENLAMFKQILEGYGAKVYLYEFTLGQQLGEVTTYLQERQLTTIDGLIYAAQAMSILDVQRIENEIGNIFKLTQALAKMRNNQLAGFKILFAGRTDGIFGFQTEAGSASACLMGAMSGFAKTLAKEWVEARCLTVDMDIKEPLESAVKAVIDDWLASKLLEIGFQDGQRFTLRRGATLLTTTKAEVLSTSVARLKQTASKVVVATGGAYGVTFNILAHMAEREPFKLVVLSRTEVTSAANSPLSNLDEAGRREWARGVLEASQKKVTPFNIQQCIDKEVKRLEACHNLDRLRAVGCEVKSLSCDVSDPQLLSKAIEEIKQLYPVIDILLHGAGAEESKFLIDKDEGALKRVFTPKASAAILLWQGLKPKRLVTMGSVAGRFGNAGQVDYAAANELMAGLARVGEHSALNIAWTAWDDVGMAMRGSLKKVLESSGVELLPAAVGAYIGAELIWSEHSGDVVVAGKLGNFDLNEISLDQEVQREEEAKKEDLTVATPHPFLALGELSPLFTNVQVYEQEGLDVAVLQVAPLAPQTDLGLDHHRLDGVAMLPGVLGVELMVEALASVTSLKSGVELRQVHFAVPLKFFRDEVVNIYVEVYLPRGAGAAPLSLKVCSDFQGPGGKKIRKEHFTAQAHLVSTDKQESLPPPPPLELERLITITPTDIYKRYFHGPAFQVLQDMREFGENGLTVGLALLQELPTWLSGVARHQDFYTAPALRETGLQAAGLFEMVELGRLALPAEIEVVHLAKTRSLPALSQLVVDVRRQEGLDAGFAIWIWDPKTGVVYDYMQGYKTIVLNDLAPNERFEPLPAKVKPRERVMVQVLAVQRELERDYRGTLSKYLAADEEARFATLKTLKRQEEWLAARIAAKRLVREVCFAQEGAFIPYNAMSIEQDVLGAPVVKLVSEELAGVSGGKPLPQISLSHSSGLAVAYLSLEPQVKPGVDIEVVEQRDPSFSKTYFTAKEQAQIAKDFEPARALTTRWALKEALLKALGIGARVDFRELEVLELKPEASKAKAKAKGKELESTPSRQWQVNFLGSALKRAKLLGVATPRIEIEYLETETPAKVLAFVQLPVRKVLTVELAQKETLLEPVRKEEHHQEEFSNV